jgi:hypothetical protein
VAVVTCFYTACERENYRGRSKFVVVVAINIAAAQNTKSVCNVSISIIIGIESCCFWLTPRIIAFRFLLSFFGGCVRRRLCVRGASLQTQPGGKAEFVLTSLMDSSIFKFLASWFCDREREKKHHTTNTSLIPKTFRLGNAPSQAEMD